MKHTPGPWRRQGEGTLLHPVSGRALTTVRVETSLGTFEVLDETNEPEGNIALIINSPELLEAGTALLPWIYKAIVDGAFKTCALPFGAGKAVERFQAVLKEIQGS